MVGENLTYLSDEYVFDRSMFESTVPEKKSGVLRTIKGPIAEWDKLNRNRRMYTEAIWDKVLESSYVTEQLRYKTLYGEANHPTDRYEVDFSRVSHSIVDMWKVPSNNQIHGTILILDTPLGRILNTLYEAGGVIGYSSRAGGSLTKRKDYTEVDEKSYNFITFDAVPYPSVESARPPVNEGVTPEKVTLSEECHRNLLQIISESSEKDKEIIKDLIYSLQSYDLAKEISLLEEVSIKEPIVKENNSVEETTKFLLKESSTQIDTLKSERSALKATVESLQSDNAELRNSLDSSLRKISNLVSESKKFDAIKTSMEVQHMDTIQRLNERISQVVSESEDLEIEYDRLKDIHEAFKAVRIERDCLKRDVQDVEKTVHERYLSEMANNKHELEEANDELSKAVIEINSLSESVEKLVAERVSIFEELEARNQLISELKERVSEMDSRIDEGVELQNSRLMDLEVHTQNLEAENSKIRQELNESKNQESRRDERYESLKKDLISVISSGYGLTVEEVSKKLPVGFTKSDIYYVCESMHNKDRRGTEFVPVVESSVVPFESTSESPNKKNVFSFGMGANRRGLGIPK